MDAGVNVSDVKINRLQKEVDKIPGCITALCNMREERYEIKRAEWEDIVQKVRAGIKSNQVLLFIGPFSSGKSTFINALLGETLLPTADRPCTSVVVELNLTIGGGHRGKAVCMDGSEEKGDWDELIKMVDGSRGAVGNLGKFHHVELYFDIQQLNDWERHPLCTLARLNVKIVDCPGYGSPYITKDEVIEEYIENANFTFWMSPANKFGGALTESKLKFIKKRTSALIPVITMADKINDAERDTVIEDYHEHLEHLFPRNREPRFVSAQKWLEAKELNKRMNHVNIRNEMPKEEKEKTKQKIDKLELESGLEQIFYDMVQSAQKPNVTESKLVSALFDLTNLLKDIDRSANEEENHCQKKAQEKGWSEDDRYKNLKEIRKKVEVWIKSEATSVADNLETAMIKELSDYIMEVNGKVETQMVNEKVYNLWDNALNKHKEPWAEYLCKTYNEYVEYAHEYSVNFDDKASLKAPDLTSITSSFEHVVSGFLDALRFGGPQATLHVGVGSALLVSTTAIGTIAIAGPALAGIAGIVGLTLIFTETIALLPVISDKIKARKEKYRQEVERKLGEWMKKLDITPYIQTMLNEENEKLYDTYRRYVGPDIDAIVRDLDRSKKIKKQISGIIESVSELFPEELKKAAL